MYINVYSNILKFKQIYREVIFMSLSEQTFELPSNGKIVDVKEVTLRSWTVAEEKVLFSSGKDTFKRIIKKCLVEPKDLDVDSLPMYDITFLVYMLRVLSQGEDYTVSTKCRNCGAENKFEFNLLELPVNKLPESWDSDKLKVEVNDGDEIQLKFLTGNDLKAIKKNMKRRNANAEDEYVYNLIQLIDTINGEKKDLLYTYEYVSSLSAKDSDKIYAKMSENRFGLDTYVIEECKSCYSDMEFELPLEATFFRPSAGKHRRI